MTISHIHAGSGAIVVVPAAQLADDTLIEADAYDSVVIVYAQGDASIATAIQVALDQRRETRTAKRASDHG